MSSHQSLSAEMLINRIAYQPDLILNTMITIPEPTKRAAINPQRKSSTLEVLDNLPLELLQMVLTTLDFQIFHGSRKSVREPLLLQSLPSYRDLIEYAPRTIAALAKTRLDCYHTIAVLHAALLSERCVSCGNYGAFLFLPSCERCCYQCLRRNQSFWVIPASLATKCFHLNASQLREIPHLLSVPGFYPIRGFTLRKRRINLVGVKSAKTVALKIHGSIQNMAQDPLISERDDTLSDEEFSYFRSLMPDKKVDRINMFRWLQKAPLHPFDRDPVMLPMQKNMPSNNYKGMGSIFFPSLLSNARLETGLWCRGCVYTCRLYNSERRAEVEIALSDSIPQDRDPLKILLGLQHRARSRTQFLEHVEHCYGAQRMLAES
ncbi:hypothetical protein A1O1_07569 [Capronia coronata CBS 617.96]|uniref:F-box domain-containing protein n=1 Tax=Capronia coronata CBS 617.96 TaxID=1182541 RepID=W9XVY3_9EURO|nr:uncharacterized protein A1O1_07569 [Capronia coronata CBS 617.96]EXJ81505.1 hypothetical protein A1O1_07569 [Capronia coronata CBS 617.96]